MPLYLQFYFWLLLISAVVIMLERLFPWRLRQPAIRDDLTQDLFWMVLNTQFVSWMLAIAATQLLSWLDRAVLHLGLPSPESPSLISKWPWWLQFGVCFVLKDFIEWNVHRGLHLVPWLWRFHQLHHSCEQLDWASTFRAHWGEIVLYKLAVYLPLIVLGVNETVVFAIVAFSLLVQELIHANLSWDWGPLRYVFNSPRFHAWHHAVEMHGRGGQNFGINLTIWDWIFRTAKYPVKSKESPSFGFEGMEDYPKTAWGRLNEPLRQHPKKP